MEILLFKLQKAMYVISYLQHVMDDCLINQILIVLQGSSLKFEMTFKRLQLNALLTMILPAILIILVDIF